MSWKNKVDIKKLQEKAKKVVATDVERDLDRIRDRIFSEAKKAGGWRAYIDVLQESMKSFSG